MGLENKHPQYVKYFDDWCLMQDALEGERAIKLAGAQYLPATPGQLLDGMGIGQTGRVNYESYKKRANYPEYVQQATVLLVGVMHHKPPKIELPEKLEPLREKATVDGGSLAMLLRRINLAQLTTGRIGLLADVRDGAPVNTLPYIATYNAQSIFNWDIGSVQDMALRKLNLVVLDESGEERTTDFGWERKTRHRVLCLGDLKLNESAGIYRTGLFADGKFSEAMLMSPSIAGKVLEEIPFVFINPCDLSAEPDKSPLLSLARLAATIYRMDADYRLSLFMQGQDTLVVKNASDENIRVGAGAFIHVGPDGDAKYVGVGAEGLSEVRTCIENDKKEAADLGGQLLNTRKTSAESGSALQVRVSARTASLNQIAITGAEGLQKILRIMAEWVGADPEEVHVVPNTDFADVELDGTALMQYTQAMNLGLPLSKKSLHRYMQDRDLTELSYEEEMSQIEEEGGIIEQAAIQNGMNEVLDNNLVE